MVHVLSCVRAISDTLEHLVNQVEIKFERKTLKKKL